MAETISTVVHNDISVGSLLNTGWALFKKYWKGIYSIGFIAVVINVLINIASSEVESVSLAFLIMMASWILSLYISTGWLYALIKVARDQEIAVGDLFSQGSRLVAYLLANLVYSFIVIFGFLLFVIPGIYWSIKYMFMPFLVVDKKMGSGEAMKASSQMTKGIWWQLFVFLLVVGLVNIAGALMLLVGLLVTVPMTAVATAVLYDRLSAKVEVVV